LARCAVLTRCAVSSGVVSMTLLLADAPQQAGELLGQLQPCLRRQRRPWPRLLLARMARRWWR